MINVYNKNLDKKSYKKGKSLNAAIRPANQVGDQKSKEKRIKMACQ